MTDDDTATDPDIATSDAFIRKLTGKATELGTYNAQAPKKSVLDIPAPPAMNTFYIENNRVHLCPIPCNTIKADGKSSLKVSFECQSTIVPPE